jgi:hypothetical protein
MLVYYAIIFTLVIIFSFNKSDNLHRSSFHFFVLLLTVLAIIRNPFIGKDNVAYFDYFNYLISGIKLGQFELLFSLYLDSFILYSNNFQIFLITTSLITLVPLFIIIKRLVNHPKYLILVLFLFLTTSYIFTFSILRNYLALPFLILSLVFLGRNNGLSSLFIILGSFFHVSILFLGVIYLAFNYIKFKPILIALVLATLMLLFLEVSILQQLLINLLDFIRPGYNPYEVVQIDNNPSITLILIFIFLDIFLYINKNIKGFNLELIFKVSLFFTFTSIFFYWIPNYYRLAILSIFINCLFLLLNYDRHRLRYSNLFHISLSAIFLVFFYLNFHSEANNYGFFF